MDGMGPVKVYLSICSRRCSDAGEESFCEFVLHMFRAYSPEHQCVRN